MTDIALDARRAALPRANAIRTERSNLWRDLQAGTTTIAEILADPPACIHEMFMTDLLRHVPGFGPTRVESLGMLAFRDGIALYVRVGRMTPTTRLWVASVLAKECRPRAFTGRRARSHRTLTGGKAK